MFVAQVEKALPGISVTEVDKRKDKHYVKWLKSHVIYLIQILSKLLIL